MDQQLILKIVFITLAVWSAIFLLSVLGSYFKWKETKNIISRLQPNQTALFSGFQAKTAIGHKHGLSRLFSVKTALQFTPNELYFLPQKYSVFLGSSVLPISLNKRLFNYSIDQSIPTQITFKWEEEMSSQIRKIMIEVKNDKIALDELRSYINHWELH